MRGSARKELGHKSNVVGDWLKVLWETKPFAHLDNAMVDRIVAQVLGSSEAQVHSCSDA